MHIACIFWVSKHIHNPPNKLPFFEDELQKSVVLGQAQISGNLYLGVEIPQFASPTMALTGNLFAHGEVGLDFLSKKKEHNFFREDLELLKSLGSYDALRCDWGCIEDAEVEEICAEEGRKGPKEASLDEESGRETPKKKVSF